MFRSYKQMTIKVKEIVDAIIAEDLEAAAAAFHDHAVKKFQDLLEAEYEDDEEAGDKIPTDSTELDDEEDEEEEDKDGEFDPEDEEDDEESDEEDEDDEDYKPYEDENETDEDEYSFDTDEDDGDLK